ncbi:hypothetical protein BFJ63_vAg6939 [Fusarium oxysporum f. sp. narcissi]|uniref:MACPF domain-containing protein n=1 Tax=Fusarium oxysporum f. sp. narcissi TaxID=451672 RepID=A0A4V1S0Y5_FUSOX|nr:hypothetical protein FOWG_03319 [Fusarium oxysporum f. sp. lycopersici MN25]RKL36018.1 hypothetical protein BFJ70_g7573 [Fusarium oxysporum]RYC90229.1 hypothetical protein BFJ63_vAg6939 [Fusarium oxysporum f. sp. narcissi]
MATQLVPYNTAMKLGSGFNSFTQTLCVDNAVVREPNNKGSGEVRQKQSEEEVPQSVIYKTSIIEKSTDVTDEMNINGAFNIKYDQLTADGSGKFINTNKIKESDVNIMVSVKVVNQIIYDHSLTKFNSITKFKDDSQKRLVDIYGDSFISGWQEGGEFLAVISIKAKNRDEAHNIAADARIAYTRNKSPAPESDKKEFMLDINAKFDKIKNDIAAENEVSVSVMWSGGGQHLKEQKKDWDFDTMKDVALMFPDLCARTPMRTHALLTRYTALRSFHETQTFDLPRYDKTGTYTNVLHEAYLDYKAILSTIQVLAFEVSEGKKALIENFRVQEAIDAAKVIADKWREARSECSTQEPTPGTGPESTEGSEVMVPGPEANLDSKNEKAPPLPKPKTCQSPGLDKAFPPTITGLEEARLKCRFNMTRIIEEIDNITVNPEIATDETRPSPYLSPFLFKLLLPLGVDLPAESTKVAQHGKAFLFNPQVCAEKLGVAKTTKENNGSE